MKLRALSTTLAVSALLLVAACGDEPLEKGGGGANAAANAAANGVTFQNNASGNAQTSPATNNDAPDPAFENPCASGPLDAPIDGCAPELLPSTDDPGGDCVRRINQLRWECQCLPPLQRWPEAEQCADEQAAYDARNLSAHAGFSEKICSPGGNAQNECPDWNSWDQVLGQCLQMMWDEGPGEDFQAHGHYINMSSPSYSRVACGSGGNWYVQNFK